MPADKKNITQLLHHLGRLNAPEFLALLTQTYPKEVIFSTSFSYEDQVITHLIASTGVPVSLFTLDTGRLFPETYAVWGATMAAYHVKIEAYYPNDLALQQFVTEKGPNCFYDSVDNRKQCCHIRKVEPLHRALKGFSVWITGLRAEHSTGRNNLPAIEWDEANQIIKYHPLLHWSTSDVKEYIAKNRVPYNPLHDKGFVSIGCAPCTRAVKSGEDFRAGRWWWEDAGKKECGLHLHAPLK